MIAASLDAQRPPTLSQLLATVGSDVLQAVCAPRGYEIPVSEPVVHGLGERMPEQEHGLLLLTGGKPTHPLVMPAVRDAAAAGYSAVILKAAGEDILELTQGAEEAGIAVIVAPDDTPWRHLDALLTAAVSATYLPAQNYSSVGLGDLFALANAIASTLGGAITIEDPQGHVQAYSNLPHQRIDEIRRLGILGRQTPERPQNLEEYRRVFRAEGTVYFPAAEGSGSFNRRSIAVRAGSQVLGIIFALEEGTPPLGPKADEALEDAAKVTALHLLRTRSHTDPERSNRAEALRSLLDGSTSARIAAAQLGIGYDTTTKIVAIAQVAGNTVRGMASARIIDLVSLYCESWHSTALCTTGPGVVYALLPVRPGGKDDSRLLKLVNDIVETIGRSAQADVYVGIGSAATHLDEVPGSRRSADRILRALADLGGDRRVAEIHDVRSRVVLLELAERAAADAELLSGPVDRMLRYDTEHGTIYGQTLLAFLDAFGDAKRAAAALSVHDNTLRYRLRRARELFGVDITDPDERLVAWLQLRFRLRDQTARPG
jgi:sugar diacid utilization regulator